jgi:hypothetical protein|tara:strand:+ start:59 stop:331 length:273 start_codon:yes stop_codon:yes gene_type:complete
MKSEKIIAGLLIIGSGIIYTIDKGMLLIADAIRLSGFKIAYEISDAHSYNYAHMKFTFDNPFAWCFLVLGISILLLSYFVEFRLRGRRKT